MAQRKTALKSTPKVTKVQPTTQQKAVQQAAAGTPTRTQQAANKKAAKNKTALKTTPNVTKTERTPEQQLAAQETRLKYLQRVRPNDPEIKKLQGKIATGKAAQPTPAATESPQPVDPIQQSQNIMTTMGGFAQDFDPRTFQTEYQPQFQEQMDKAYNTVMNQFELRNQRAFEQQKHDLDQEAAMKGWDPSGQNYQTRYREMMDAQNQARQEAQNAASQRAFDVQQQGYQQATGAALMPGQIYGQFADPYAAQQQFGYQQQLGQQQFQNQQALARQQFGYDIKKMQAMPRGGGGGGAAYDPWSQYELNQLGAQYAPQQQQQQQNPWSQAIGSFVGSFGGGLGAGLGKKIGG